MALILLAGAGYAYYKSQGNVSPEEYPLDSAICLEGKVAVDFLPLELRSPLLSNAVTTITFYKGDYRAIKEPLEQRVQEILSANPWLSGWLAKKPGDNQIKLWYDPEGKDMAPSIFTVFEPGDMPLKRDTQFVQYHDICSDYAVKVPSAAKLIGRNIPVWKVSIVPDAVEHFSRFALIVSQSQFLGDNYTYYKLFGMLSPESPVAAMNPIRHQDFQQEMEKYMGPDEAYYFEKSAPDLLDQMMENYCKKKRNDVDSGNTQNKIETLLFTISKDWLDSQTQQAIIDEQQRQQKISSNSTIAIENNATATPLRPAEIVLSWWFKLSGADIGLYAHELRSDLDVLSENDAGTYSNPIPYTHDDFATPQLIRDSIQIGRRSGVSSETGERIPLPRITTGKTFALGLDWNRHHPNTTFSGTEDIVEDLHIPLLTAEELCSFSSKISCCILFTANSQRIGAFVVAKKEICDRILGSGIVDEDMKTSLTKNLANKRGSVIVFNALPDLETLSVDITLDDYEGNSQDKSAEGMDGRIEKEDAAGGKATDSE
ncbi:hypothetical protein IV203_021297 [Nitzschia inconspicua]|uniref:Uncharacterized protein n=1 Tax=Nitzschia inconspicua TaxID=303405 RepID=A0A9K3KGN6_9STRA|nr:hypothetical protein IV203_021297 [Nitzschia inconspicua]